jgi:hypothetical protein
MLVPQYGRSSRICEHLDWLFLRSTSTSYVHAADGSRIFTFHLYRSTGNLETRYFRFVPAGSKYPGEFEVTVAREIVMSDGQIRRTSPRHLGRSPSAYSLPPRGYATRVAQERDAFRRTLAHEPDEPLPSTFNARAAPTNPFEAIIREVEEGLIREKFESYQTYHDVGQAEIGAAFRELEIIAPNLSPERHQELAEHFAIIMVG